MARVINGGDQGNNLMAVLALIAQLQKQDEDSKIRNNQLSVQIEQMRAQTGAALEGVAAQREKNAADKDLAAQQLAQKNRTDYASARNALVTSPAWEKMTPEQQKRELDALDKMYGVDASAQAGARTLGTNQPPVDPIAEEANWELTKKQVGVEPMGTPDPDQGFWSTLANEWRTGWTGGKGPYRKEDYTMVEPNTYMAPEAEGLYKSLTTGVAPKEKRTGKRSAVAQRQFDEDVFADMRRQRMMAMAQALRAKMPVQ